MMTAQARAALRAKLAHFAAAHNRRPEKSHGHFLLDACTAGLDPAALPASKNAAGETTYSTEAGTLIERKGKLVLEDA